ncbi:peroxiredoxin [Nocardioides zeae]|uniref:Peroxiredoxin n=1 Tax=Nocardioides imazamoxiresistens TaxID=3231893 RepID=A0ABU3Q0S3_9ACTN|nr:peroxiredoxin [Nocardioides zeae]MDT9595036.1 peroxiredoxin [Nocardioides zeae]
MSESLATVTPPGVPVGVPAPDLALRDQFGQTVRLSDFRDRKAVALMFLPFAFSGVCTGELGAVQARVAEFLTFDTELLVVSCDPVYALRAFADRDGLTVPLLSDFWPHGEVARAYGVFDAERGCPSRSSYVVDRAGRVSWSVHNEMAAGRDLDAHLMALRAALSD